MIPVGFVKTEIHTTIVNGDSMYIVSVSVCMCVYMCTGCIYLRSFLSCRLNLSLEWQKRSISEKIWAVNFMGQIRDTNYF